MCVFHPLSKFWGYKTHKSDNNLIQPQIMGDPICIAVDILNLWRIVKVNFSSISEEFRNEVQNGSYGDEDTGKAMLHYIAEMYIHVLQTLIVPATGWIKELFYTQPVNKCMMLKFWLNIWTTVQVIL